MYQNAIFIRIFQYSNIKNTANFCSKNSGVNRIQGVYHVIYTLFRSSLCKGNCMMFHHFGIRVTDFR